MKYRWLHLTDLHSYCMDINNKAMRDGLITEVRELQKEESFDFILITGDLADKSKGYSKAVDFIKAIMVETGLSGDRIFIVPGNHDLDRKIPVDRVDLVKEVWEKGELPEEQEDYYVSKLIKAQSEFFSVYEEITSNKYPLDQVHFNKRINDDINIINLNTSWMCVDSIEDEGRLHIGLKHLYDCLDKKGNAPINIAIGHHRISDFKAKDGNYLKRIFKDKEVDLYLGGHCHNSVVVYDPIIETEFCSCKQVRVKDDDYPAGFIVGTIDTYDEQSCFQFYNWHIEYGKWIYDYEVDSAKHGKYYLNNNKFNRGNTSNRNILFDFKILGTPLDLKMVSDQFNLGKCSQYRYQHKDIRPRSKNRWDLYLRSLRTMYKQVIEGCSGEKIHLFVMAPTPLQVALGYMFQNNSTNLSIYQYNEDKCEWAYDQQHDKIPVEVNYLNNDNNKLAIKLEISNQINNKDISAVLGFDYDILEVRVDDPKLSYVNYRGDVIEVKNKLQSALNTIHNNYNELHLFLAAPSGLCVEVGRIIRENMYPDTFVYNYRVDTEPRYTKVYNLKNIKL